MNTEINRQNPYLVPKPCNFDPQILPDLILQQQLDKEKGEEKEYQLIQGGQKDWDEVLELYNRSPDGVKKVANVQVIVNRGLSGGFDETIKLFQRRGGDSTFQSSWERETKNIEELKKRHIVNEKLKEIAKPVQDFKNVKVVKMFHGTRKGVLSKIFRTNLANLSTEHGGLFGKGVYHTSSAQYAQIYAKDTGEGALLMSWVCFSSVYPVIHHPEVPDDIRETTDERWRKLSDNLKEKHWVSLTGKEAAFATNYNAHYVLVCPTQKKTGKIDYYPFVKDEQQIYDEFITFLPNQVLPRYLVTLTPSVIHKPLHCYTAKHFQKAVQQMTNLPALTHAFGQKIFQKELANEELVELGHLLSLQQIKDDVIRKESIQYLETNRAIEGVGKQYPICRSSIAVDELFRSSKPNKIYDAGNDPFEPIERHINEKNQERSRICLSCYYKK